MNVNGEKTVGEEEMNSKGAVSVKAFMPVFLKALTDTAPLESLVS